MRANVLHRAMVVMTMGLVAGVLQATLPQRAAAQAPAADVNFVQGMIGHHAQALEMTALVPARSKRPALHLIAERIDASQRDEITQMQQWLRTHGGATADSAAQHAGHDARPPAAGAHAAAPHAAHAALMPGMLTADELAALAAASGDGFDRQFLQLMIRHHEGALVMVADLLRTPGAARQPQLYQFAADVDADQRAEIGRMRRLLATIPNE